MKIDLNFFPNWTRKAITYSIDDGRTDWDAKFLNILRPAGICGTFNLCGHNLGSFDAEGYREFYRGCEISNHVSWHPFCQEDGHEYPIADTFFDEDTAKEEWIYPDKTIPNLYHIHRANGWRYWTTAEGYISMTEDGREKLEAIFGKGNIPGFVWPFTVQHNAELNAYLRRAGYYGLREGCCGDKENFHLPADRMTWKLVARHSDLLDLAAKFEAAPDDGELRWFSFGVHSIDYETADKWDDLRTFAKQYGNRPETFFYAPVGTIFAYEDAIRSVIVTDYCLRNPSDLDLCIMIHGERVTLSAHKTIQL